MLSGELAMTAENYNLIEYYFSKTLDNAEKAAFKKLYETSDEFKRAVDEQAKIMIVLKGLSMQEQRQREKQADAEERNRARQAALQAAKRQALVSEQEQGKQNKTVAELLGATLPVMAGRKLPRWLVPTVIATAVIAVLALALTILFAVSFSARLNG